MIAPSFLVLAALAQAPAEAPSPQHQLTFLAQSGFSAYLAPSRTQGGVGGGVGLRDTVGGLWLLQADASLLTGLGSVLVVRLGAGVQYPGTFWIPAARVSLLGLFGDEIGFVMPERDFIAKGPGLGVGLSLAPVRFQLGRAQVSLVEPTLGVGLGGIGGAVYGLTLLEVGVAL